MQPSHDEETTHKLYHSIKEVARMFDVNESTLRYWETQFPLLRPKTTAQKVRMYTQRDIEQVKQIHSLVKVRGFKIAAARKMLNQNRAGVDKSADVLTALIDVRDDLKALKKQLDYLE